MEKAAMSKYAKVLKEASAVILQVTEERDVALAKLAEYERKERAVKVASKMHEKGVDYDTPIDKLAERLCEADRQGKLDTIEHAVDLVGPDMGRKLASLSDDRISAVGSTALERYLLGSDGQ